MADEIKADYDQLEQVAGRFGNQAQVVEHILQSVRAAYDKLENGGWMGRGADAFFAEMQSELLPAVQRLSEVLDDASQTTKAIAQTFRHAEEEASGPFRNMR